MELFNLAVNLAYRLDQCNPDVGMGPSRLDIAKKISKHLSFKIDEDDIEEICETITRS
jgi:hypothetical protein